MTAPHIPVLLDEVLTALAIVPGERHIDGTYGAGGYSRAMLDAGVEIDREDIAASAFGRFDEVPFDASGRFILPPFLRNKGALTALAFFWGAGDTIEIWSPEKLLADPNADAAKKERCAWLMTERGAS